MSIKLRTVTDTSTSSNNQLESDGSIATVGATTPLTTTDVDNNFITLKQKIEEIEEDYDATFTSSGAVKDGAISTASISTGSITSDKIKDRAVDWSDQRAIVYLTDTSVKVNEVHATLSNYLSDTGLSALPSNTVLAFKAVAGNSSAVKLVLKNKDGSDDATDLISLEIFKQKDVPLSSGDIKEGGFYLVYYDGDTLQLVNSLQDPEVVVEQNISAVSTFGPLLFDLATLGNNTASSQDHLLGARPTTYDAFLVCQTAEHGYATNDLVPLDSLSSATVGVGAPIIVRASNTAITVTKTYTGVDKIKIPSAIDGDPETLTPGNWKVEVRGTYREDNTYSPAYVDRSLDYMVRAAHGAVTVGNYLYYFYNGHYQNDKGKHARLRKVNLITNIVIDCGYAGNTGNNHLCNCSYIKYSADDKYKATTGTIISGQGGSSYTLNDILTLASGEGASTSLATFKVTEVNSGVVTKVEVVSPGDYTSLPNNGATGVATTVQPSGGSGAKVNVNWEVNFDKRIFWTTPGGHTYYIQVNGSDTPEAVIPATTTASSDQFVFQVQEFNNGFYWAFRNRDEGASSKKLYKWQVNSTRGIHQASKTLDFTQTSIKDGKTNPFRDYEQQGYSGTNPIVKLLQWNPIKKRIYVVTRSGWVVHVYEIPFTTLQDWFDASGQPHTHLTYLKTVGIPGAGGGDNDSYYDGLNIDIDVTTGEEKSISIANYNSMGGKVSRLAWREG